MQLYPCYMPVISLLYASYDITGLLILIINTRLGWSDWPQARYGEERDQCQLRDRSPEISNVDPDQLLINS